MSLPAHLVNYVDFIEPNYTVCDKVDVSATRRQFN